MSVISQKLKREDKIREYINQFLSNIGQDCGEEWWIDSQADRELARLAWDSPPQITDSIELDIDCEDVLVVSTWDGGTNVTALEQLMADIQKQAEENLNTLKEKSNTSLRKKTIQFLFFTSDLKSRTALEMKLDQVQKRTLANAIKKSSGLQVVCNYTFVIDREYHGETVRINNINRYNCILMPPISGNPNIDIKEKPENDLPGSIVLTVPLRQLVDLYNQVGDQLFKRNVRLGISDKLDLQRAMCQTLETEPQYFWHMNNGITLLVDDPSFRLRSADTLELGKLEYDGVPHFSVINGAQTISICSKYAFMWEYYKENCPESSSKRKEEAIKRLESFEKAQVLLRVIHVPLPLRTQQNASPEEQQNIRLADNISISLNRQKPVKQEDIAFTTPFVQKMLEYLEDTADAPFCLVRRGENRGDVPQMDLVAFSKARLACSDQPGKARAVSSGEIMKLEAGTDCFSNKDIFVEDWLADDIDRDRVFKCSYGAVLFANQLEACYKGNQKTVQKRMQGDRSKQDALTALSNGSWYFTALLVQLLNGFTTDYSEFDCTVPAIKDKIPQAMQIFAGMAVNCADGEIKLDSNSFKNDELYKRMLRKLKEAPRESFFREFVVLFADFRKAEYQKKELQEKTRSGSIQIAYGPAFKCGSSISADTAADAFVHTVKNILASFVPEAAKLEGFSSWLTDDREKCRDSKNYSNNPPSVVCGGKTYWIATSINNKSKFAHLNRLCALAKVPQGELAWTKDGDDLYKW